MGLDRRLYDAVKKGNIEQVKQWLEKGANPNAPVGKNKMTCMARAIGKYPNIASLLVEYGAMQLTGTGTLTSMNGTVAQIKNKQLSMNSDESSYLQVHMSTLAAGACGTLKSFQRLPSERSMIVNTLSDAQETEETQVERNWEFNRAKLRQVRKIGQGTFGVVFEGAAEGILPTEPTTRVAVKMLTEGGDAVLNNFNNEVKIMKAIDGPHNIVRLLGVCTEAQPFLMIMELMEKGDLKTVLRHSRPKEDKPAPFGYQQLVRMGVNIAEGMAYLADLNVVHRDLAARNCLVTDDYTVKVGDFGLTRDTEQGEYYRMTGSAPLPIRWMSPEAIMDGVYTTYSDIWSFGVVLWELLTFAKLPYGHLSNSQICDMVTEDNYRLQIPRGCPTQLYALMMHCWKEEPKERGNFKEIQQQLEEMAPQISSEPIIRNGAARADEVDEEVPESRNTDYLRDADRGDSEPGLYVDARYAHLTSMDQALKVAQHEQLVLPFESGRKHTASFSSRVIVEDMQDNDITAPNPTPPTAAASTTTTKTATPPPTTTKTVTTSSSIDPSKQTPITTITITAEDPIPKTSNNITALDAQMPSITPVTRSGAAPSQYHLANDQSATAVKMRHSSNAAADKAERDIRAWMQKVLGVVLSGTLEEALHSGEMLCALINRIRPGAVPRVHQGTNMAFKQMENIGYFLDACRVYGVADADMFMTVDLFDGINIKQVICCLFALKNKAEEKSKLSTLKSP